MAYQVYETNFKEKELLIVGIEGNGYKVAQRIVTILESISNIKIKIGKIKLDNGDILTNTPIFAVKKYEQQYSLSYHFTNVWLN